MQTKLAQLKDHMATGNHRAALKLAASWPRLGEHKDAIQLGWSAMSNPRFYRDINKDPDALVAAGLAAIRERYNIEEETPCPE